MLTLAAASAAGGEPKSVEQLFAAAGQALEQGSPRDALTLANEGLRRDPGGTRLRLLRATVHETLQQFDSAIADYTQLLNEASDPASVQLTADLYHRRGSAHFFAAHIGQSISDFDKEIELQPAREKGHWKRGICYYYAGRYEDGCRQFAAYQDVDSNDVENAVWWFLCKARSQGLDSARQGLLKVGRDRRVPMNEIYALFAGRAQADDVLTAAQAGHPSEVELAMRRFYAELYLGLWDEVGERHAQAAKHMRRAVNLVKNGGYMWQVARVHLELSQKRNRDAAP